MARRARKEPAKAVPTKKPADNVPSFRAGANRGRAQGRIERADKQASDKFMRDYFNR